MDNTKPSEESAKTVKQPVVNIYNVTLKQPWTNSCEYTHRTPKNITVFVSRFRMRVTSFML